MWDTGCENLNIELMTVKTPAYPWKCTLVSGTYLSVQEGQQPNWFHRKMQQLCFGFKWEKINGELQDCQ
jgi:hypothetical protein